MFIPNSRPLPQKVQEYSLRFQPLCTQLKYAGANEQTINHYFTRLHTNIRTALQKYRAMIRNAGIGNGPAPSWDFRSLAQLMQRAMACR